MNTHRVSANLGIALLSRAATASLAILIVGLMTRHLGSGGYGEYTTIFAYLFMFSILADFGLYTILTREISKKDADESFIAGNIFTMRMAFITGFVLLAFLIVRFLPYSPSVKTGIFIGAMFSVFSSLSQILAGIYQKYLRFYYVSVSDVVSKFIQLGIVYFAISNGLGLLTFVWAVVIAACVHFATIFILAQRFVAIRFRFNAVFWKKIIRIAVPVAASIVFTVVYFRLDTVMLSVMKPAHDVGIYGVGAKVLETIIFFPSMYVGLVLPMLSRFAKTDRQRFSRVFRKTFDYLALFMVPVVVYLFMLAEPIAVLIGGNEFIDSAVPLKFFAFAAGFIFFGALGGQSIIALNLQRYGMWAYLSGAVLNFSANLVFIPVFSYAGAAATTVATEILVTILLFSIIAKKSRFTAQMRIVMRACFAGAVMAAAVYWFRSAFILYPLAIGAVSYISAAYAFKAFTKKDAQEFLMNRVPGVTSDIEY